MNAIVVPCSVCLTSNRVTIDERTREARCGTCGETWIHRLPERERDVVRYVEGDHSVLDHGPGLIVEIRGENAFVRVMRTGTVLGNHIRAGEAFWFARRKLTVTRTAAGVELPPIGAPTTAAPTPPSGGPA